VYCATDALLARTVAIKTVALAGSEEERDRHEARFLQEARAAGGISHPSIVTIYDAGREGDTAFIAMELVEGRDLRALIAEASLAPVRAVEIAAAVGDGLAYAHERGIVHRDIKPGNIMVLADGRVKIMDFGIARLREPTVKTQTGVLLGSPQYMSPEQIVGQEVDHRSDIFALGLVFYEMITGSRPFEGEDIPSLMFKVANMPETPPTHLVSDLPPVVDLIVARALKKRADDRYQGAAEMAKDLRDALGEVAAAQVDHREAAHARTVPQSAGATGGRTRTSPGLQDDALQLRPSPRFDSADGLARLAVLPEQSDRTGTRAGWTVQASPLRKRMDPARATLFALYAAAAVVAVLLALR
jgi:serine/threonine-protein kinase